MGDFECRGHNWPDPGEEDENAETIDCSNDDAEKLSNADNYYNPVNRNSSDWFVPLLALIILFLIVIAAIIIH